MKKTNIVIAIVFILLAIFIIKIGLSNSGEKKHEGKEKTQIKVDAFIVSPSSVISDITVTGSIVAFDEVELRNEVAGRIVMVNLPEGKQVKKGVLLVKLYDADLQAILQKLESQLDIQDRILKRQAQLLKVNGISQNEYEQTLLQIKSLNADISEEKALIRKTEVRAPFDGTIGLRNVSEGAVVNTSTQLATIRTNQKLKLDFFVPEKYSSIISNGMKVSFTMANSQHTFNAKVIATEQGIENDTRNLKVRAIINTTAKELIPGAFANVTLRLGENSKALMIPTQAVIPDQESKSVIVARGGKAHMQSVQTGIRKSSNIEVTEGLEPGDTIMTSGILFLKEGDKLNYSSITK